MRPEWQGGNVTEFGFGLVDRRTVLAVLFTFSISHLLLGNQIPIDTGSILSILFGIVILTGSVFMLRTLSRIVIATSYFLMRIPFDVFISIREAEDHSSDGATSRKTAEHVLRRLFSSVRQGLATSLLEALVIPLVYDKHWRFRLSRYDLGIRARILYGLAEDNALIVDLGILGFLDRIALVVLSYVLTIPIGQAILQLTGVAGVILLLIVFTVTGRFTFVLKDPFHEEEDKKDQLLDFAMRAGAPIR
jgi:hypothetical protein